MECPECGSEIIMKQKSKIKSEWSLKKNGEIKKQKGECEYMEPIESYGECIECGKEFNFNRAKNRVELDNEEYDIDS